MHYSPSKSRVIRAVGWGCVLVAVSGTPVVADPPNGATVDGQTPAPSGDFFSSLKQAFKQDLDHEVVRGHFDVGTPPDTHRYYCLVNPKTGASESNGVGGEPVVRPDGMTGIKSGAVGFYSCANAEKQGILVTSGYVLSAGASAKIAQTAQATRATPIAPVAPAQTKAPPHEDAPADGRVASDVMAVYARFIAGENAHDRAAVADVLLDSKDFVWAQYRGNSIWGREEALEAMQRDWLGNWHLEPQLKEARVATVAPGVAVLITPLLFTEGAAGEKPDMVPIRWGGVFVKTSSGWRIASIFITPYKGWSAAAPTPPG
jgi:hypothetical protein